jgi:hypothetical protein
VVKSVTLIPVKENPEFAKLDGFPPDTVVATVKVGDAEAFKVLVGPGGDPVTPTVPPEVLAFIKASVPVVKAVKT